MKRNSITFAWKVTRLANTVRPSPSKRAGVEEVEAGEKRIKDLLVAG